VRSGAPRDASSAGYARGHELCDEMRRGSKKSRRNLAYVQKGAPRCGECGGERASSLELRGARHRRAAARAGVRRAGEHATVKWRADRRENDNRLYDCLGTDPPASSRYRPSHLIAAARKGRLVWLLD
jgi:hypothetical protein